MDQGYADLIGKLGEIGHCYLTALSQAWPRMILFTALMLSAWYIWQRLDNKPQETSRPAKIFLALFIVAGLIYALSVASLFDDAFISFRYARNLTEGQGLVFNPGERVEGYTNFLWTILIALGAWLTGFDEPLISLVLGPICFVANLLVVFRLGRLLTKDKDGGPLGRAPLAALLLCVSGLFVRYATTGMETMAASLLVDLGLYYLLTGKTSRRAFFCGLFFVLAVLTRPDMAIFLAIAALLIIRRSFKNPRIIAPFFTPWLVLPIYLGWKFIYYGALLPNTFWAKSADQSYFSQGLIYQATFYLGSHFYIVALLFIAWLFWPSVDKTAKQARLFCGSTFFVYSLYLLHIGGDFMYGRFFIVLMPLMLLGAQALVADLGGLKNHRGQPRKLPAIIAAVLLAATVHGTTLFKPGEVRWGIADESSFYRVLQLGQKSNPIWLGRFMGRAFYDRGLLPLVASTNIGMLGYYSRLPIIDVHGLTDPVIASRKLTNRSRPGHEKSPTLEYLLQRRVTFSQENYYPEKFLDLVRTRFVSTEGDEATWYLLTYDRKLMKTIRETVPEIEFVDFEAYLDRYIVRLSELTTATIAADLAWFNQYYFDHNDDPRRLAAIRAALADGESGSVRPRI